MPPRRQWPLLAAILVVLVPAVPSPAAADYQQVVDLTFPVGGTNHYSDSYDAPRSGGRVHKATDIMAPEGAPVYAAVGGTIEWITGLDGSVPDYGFMIRIAGDDGRDYAYIHLGRQDGSPDDAYVAGLADGHRVARGQQIGYVGCSGNASCSAPHLHFEIHDESVTDPYGDRRINPYSSLLAAEDRGDYAHAATYPFDDVAGSPHRPAILQLSEDEVMAGCDDRRFCPNDVIGRTEIADVLVRALDVPDSDKDHFSDDDGLPAEPAINALAAAGIVLGCGEGRYCPDETVSRARMASYLARAFALPEVADDFFADDDGHGHEANINRLAASGITVGCTADRFCVAGQVTRGQIASFLVRGLER